MARIAIIGGHGKIALKLERLLSARGDDVDAIVRNPEHASDVESAGATPVVADVETLGVDALARLLADHDAVVWSAGAGGGSPERTDAVDRRAAIRSMDASAQAGIARYVMVSYFRSPDRTVPVGDSFRDYAEAKADADEHLAATDLDWTILGPSRLTDLAGRGTIDARATASGEVSRDDVAAVIAAVLVDPSTIGRTIRFNDGDVPIADAIRG
ncbi:NAD-dependent dehydratase [Agromyces protaetiae]|uniref:NAD-dependent dehydratase n=1 Tax=Agromyces protaetiae TaxID=2509455 RepID=A0A4P6F8V9_9MICO|nr:NAD(P)H-binding protein [Agromyces protaetiae]QAY71966.1 NAD-dependent dehydratase [Agromyces protaetiae]